MTDYLGRHAAASVPGIRLICKYVVANGPTPRSQIQDALRPPGIVPRTDGQGATLPASFEVARDIGLLTTDGGKQDPIWSPGPCLETFESASAVLNTGDAFRPLILQSLSTRAVKAVSDNERPSDLSMALTWILSRDPLIQTPWDHRGTELTIKAEGMSEVIDNDAQWNAFRRWFTALRLGAAVHFSGRDTTLSVSAASAIRDCGIETQGSMPAREFVSSLLSAVPVLGHELLLSQLPAKARPAWEGVASPAIAQGLLELEAIKTLRMLPGDDSEAVVLLAVGHESRAVRSIEWLSEGR